MKAAHRTYGRALEAVAAARQSGKAKLVADAERVLAEATAAVADDLDAAWRRNIDAVQAAKQHCRDAITARARTEATIAIAVNERLRDPTWPTDSPLVTDAEQHVLDAATEAQEAAIEANRQAEENFKQGVTVEQLAAS